MMSYLNNKIMPVKVKLIRVLIRQEFETLLKEREASPVKLVYDKKETAEMLGMSMRTLDRRRKEGLIFALENVEKGKVLFALEEIKRVIEKLSNNGR